MKRPFKIVTVIIGICVFALFCICATAARCGPEYPYLYDLAMVEFNDEEHGAYFIKAEHEYGGYGWFTDSYGIKTEVYYSFSTGGNLQVLPVHADNPWSEPCFYAVCEYSAEELTLTCDVGTVSDKLDLDFEQLVFNISEINYSALRPYDLISATWSDENDIFLFSNRNSYFNRTSSLSCYTLTDEGYIEYKNLALKWGDYSFEIFDGKQLVASGTYDFNAAQAEITLVFEEDGLFGDNKPFASYPFMTVKSDWRAYNY